MAKKQTWKGWVTYDIEDGRLCGFSEEHPGRIAPQFPWLRKARAEVTILPQKKAPRITPSSDAVDPVDGIVTDGPRA